MATLPERPVSKRPTGRQVCAVVGLGLATLLLSASAAVLLRGHRGTGPPPAAGGSPPAEAAARVGRGRAAYLTYCASCHGTEGHGDGLSAAGLKVPPRDFARGPWKYGTEAAAVRKVIADGIPGAGMPAAGQSVSAAELDALTAYVLSLAPRPPPGGETAAAFRLLLERAGLVAADVPAPAPSLELRGDGGQAASPIGLRGKVVLLVFWETSCAPCLGKLSGLARLAERFRDRGLAVLPVCLDEADAGRLRAVAARHAPGLTLYAEPRGVARVRYDVAAVPAVRLLDRDGRLLAAGPGPGDWSGAAAEEVVRAALALPAGDRSR